MSERLQMEGKLSVLQKKRHGLKMRMDGLCQSIRAKINPALVDVAEMDIPLAAQQMDDLVMASAELLDVTARIARLERELHG